MGRKGQRRISTRVALLKAAEKVFSEQGYNKTSVSSICSQAKVAQGTFYRYFTNKEDIYAALAALLERFFSTHIANALSNIDHPVHKLVAALETYWKCIEKRRTLYQVFREAEFVNMNISQKFYSHIIERFAKIIEEGICQKCFTKLDPEIVAICILGAIEFAALRHILWQWESNKESAILSTIKRFVFEGIDPEGTRRPMLRPTLQESFADEEAQTTNSTKSALLSAAKKLFGQKGFHQTTVAEIALEANVGQGTFYLYFPSKEAIFVTLVQEINENLRNFIRSFIKDVNDRRDIECLGFQAFFNFISRHTEAYRIIREAEFVNGEAGRWFYQRLAQPYARKLKRAMDKGEIILLEPETLAYALLGVGHFIGLRWFVWEKNKQLPAEVLQNVLEFILHGLKNKV